MFSKTLKSGIMVVFGFSLMTWASDCNYYTSVGRSLMFDGTLSGMRLAYETFDNGLNDPGCPDCSTCRELRFWHAVTGTAMLIIRDDSGSVDSVFELLKQFDIEVLGDCWAPYFEPLGLDFDPALNQYDAYEIPAAAPDAREVRNIIDTSMIPQIEAIIEDLNSIGDSPGDRFKMFLKPEETRIFFHPNSPVINPASPDYDPNSRFVHPLEVDYGEVLLLKGLLMALKAQLEAQAAYDMYVDANDMLIEKDYGESFNMNADLLDPHPDFLKVLPTANDANDGAVVLARTRQDWIHAINYYLDTIEYISNEDNPAGTDPQDDEFLYIDPNDKDISDNVNERLEILRDSLIYDTVATIPMETAKIYTLQDANLTATWKLELVFDFIGLDSEGSFVLIEGNSPPSPWEITGFDIEDDELFAEMEYDVPGYWGGGALLTGMMSPDHNSITNATFEYWGPDFGTIYNLSGRLVDTKVEEERLDMNPVFASSTDVNSPRYTQPVNPRDLLPVFDQWNGALPGTVGHGLGDDPTLSGIVPDMTQYDWQLEFDLQPGGLFYLQEVYPWQVGHDVMGHYVGIWLEHQLVLDDPAQDTWEDVSFVDNVDIDRLYMGYDDDYLYGAIILYDYNSAGTGQAHYNLYLSYTPDDTDSSDNIKLEISLNAGMVQGWVCHMNDSYGYPYWDCMGMINARMGQNGIDFNVSWYHIPGYLPGRFISLNVSGSDSMWYSSNGEENQTHLKIGEVGTISGTVSYSAYSGAPIFVQAYTDYRDPEDSLVAGTVITAPGPYTLEGIGLGWEGYVRAFTHLFGFNVFDLEALTIQDSESVFLWLENLDGVDLVLNNPILLEKNVCVDGVTDPNYGRGWYSFYAVRGGTYTLDLNRVTSQYAYMTIYGRDGHTELQELPDWQIQHIDWVCPVSGRYYIKVTEPSWQTEGGTYQICMTSNVNCPRSDIGASDWAGVEDCKVNFYDLSVLISHWLHSCAPPYWCDESDFNESLSVNFADFAMLAGEWLREGTP